jgi:flavorubredoxin
MYRLMKATHEYGAGTATFYLTTSKNLEVVMDLLQTMREAKAQGNQLLHLRFGSFGWSGGNLMKAGASRKRWVHLAVL